MGAELLFDFKLTLKVLEKIGEENIRNEEINNALEIAYVELRKAIVSQGNVIPRSVNFEITELYSLFRTRVSLSLIRSVNSCGENNKEIDTALSKILEIVEEKIIQEKELEENKNEKNSRR